MTDIVNQRGGIVSAKDLTRAEYTRVLRAVGRGELIKVRQGVYATPQSLVNTMVDVEKIVPNGVICLYNAWAYHKLSTTIPPSVCIAIETKRKVRLPDDTSVQLYYWKNEYLHFGIEEREYSGYKVRITDLERSVCDAIKYRNKIGLDLCGEVVRSYLKRTDRSLSKLYVYAKRLRVANVLNNYLEINLE
ncbi:MAG: type IV toxin-antitoxin system AbiEi family antitoxin domain-containing protein [Bacteroidales bacterium]|nr:type IV toxin-antitoxin system AbiEi family antitoxin domain-containing protein [Bacteroidales bacterium]